MFERVTKVAQGFEDFATLPHPSQLTLLKHNADMMVILQGALFFQGGSKGLDQVESF